MNKQVSKNLAYAALMISVLICHSKTCSAQKSRPGLPGMSMSKWITIKNTQAPGRVYGYKGLGGQTYTQEDLFFKAWIPVANFNKFALILGPQYRTEQLEYKGTGENPLSKLSHWNLRSVGIDVKSSVALDSTSWLVFGANVNQSGNLRDESHSNIPLSYTFTSAFLTRRSANREVGFGVMLNRSFSRFTVLPVFMFHYNYSTRGGFEINLPYKIAWRNNLSPTDILYVKAEGVTRSYWINDGSMAYAFRRTVVDLGLAYNKQFTKLLGAEFFGGYRRNISTHMPDDVNQLRMSGLVFSLEIYMRSPFK
jgi:hypothetical protein